MEDSPTCIYSADRAAVFVLSQREAAAFREFLQVLLTHAEVLNVYIGNEIQAFKCGHPLFQHFT